MRFPAFATIRSSGRVWFATLLAGVGFAAVAAPAAQASLGVETLDCGQLPPRPTKLRLGKR